MKGWALILGIMLLVTAIFGCTSSTQYGKQSGNNTNFSIPEGWELHFMPGEGTVIWMDGDPRIRVIEMNKQKFDSKHDQLLHIDNTTYMVKTQNRTIEGIKVETFWTTAANSGDIQDYYFFFKNNKYYYLSAWAYTGWDSSKQSSYRQQIDKAVKTIVSTIT
ncbi:hypothetical protein [Methanobacterium sp.]|uniref:hypothetical protein n=1 Tax=Methanobacterium sp. TaxID=2164 RepID=UPI003C77E4B6